ncbi:peptidase S9 [Niastella koreensis]|uniref:Secreted prolyl oligopeptidase family protein n=2 Tax=Niastella koreensis TaxID=354356 RepID=G8TCC1_NIAKG|nr:prolyl oligopeptidase family serine peptidase [Niastella koreensis]AEW01428.1 secreted prolyl oligopeptidase family protein [Niastella koreensis GR20-10]OQP48837.1 peptidase S9 [Niastella koreensis]
MKPILTAFALACFAFNSYSQTAVKQYTIEQFYKTIAFGGGNFNNAENKIIVHDNSSGIFNVYEIDLATKAKKQLTSSDKESYFSIDYIPGTSDFLYSADKGGNENTHIYLQKADGAVTDLTPGVKEKADFFNWNHPKTAFYYSSNVRDARFFDLYKMSPGDWKPVLLYQNDKGLDVASISPDENWLVLTKSITSDKNDMYLLNRKTNELKKLSAETEATYSPQSFELDNSAFYYATNEGSEFTYLLKYDLATGKQQKIFSDKWDVEYMYTSKNGKYHVIGVNEDGRNKVLLYDHKTGKQLAFPAIKEGYVQGVRISPTEKSMVIYIAGDRSPVNLYAYNFASKKLDKLTNSLNPEIDPNDLVDAEVVRFKSFDGLLIPAIYYKPKNATASNKVPALVWVHGGPGGQSTAGYSQAIQYFVNHGYAILAVNNRGSSGYGKTYYKMDNRNHGDKDLKDCVWGKKWLAQQPYINPTSIGIYGGSYGGFMSLAGIIQYPAEFKVGVDLFGVTNWLRTLQSIPAYWESFRKALYEELGDPATDSVRLRSISPLFNTDKIKTPLLVLQGSNDPRVLQVESDEIVAGARKNGTPVEYVLFPDEGHGFRKKENQMKAAKVTLEFLNKYLSGNPDTADGKKGF